MRPLLKDAFARRARLLPTTLAIAVAVTLVAGTFLLTDTVRASYGRASKATAAPVDVVVRAASRFSAQDDSPPEREPLPESLLGTVRSVPGVGSAWGSIPGPTEGALGQEGRVQEIAVRVAPGVAPGLVRARLAAALPDSYEAVSADRGAGEVQRSWTNALAFLATALVVLGAVALLAGAFVIFNTFSILVVQRARELALLRAVGATRLQLTGSVLVEAAAVGTIGSGAGVGLGWGAAQGLLGLARRVGYEDAPAAVVVQPRTAVVAFLSGVLVTLAAAVVPAWRATGVAPAAGAAGRGSEPGGSVHARLLPGTFAVLAAAAMLLAAGAGEVRHPLPVVAVGAATLLAGLVLLAPVTIAPVAALAGAPLARLLGQPARLGRENAVRDPRRSAATAAALMIGIGLFGVVAVLAASMKASAARSVDRTLLADLVVVAPGRSEGSPGGGGVPRVVAERLRQLPGVETVSEFRGGQWGLNGRTRTLLAIDPATVGRVQDLDRASAASLSRLDEGSVLVRDSVARRHHWRLGEHVPMTFARTGTRPMRLVGTFSNPAVRTDYVVSLAAFEANYESSVDAQVQVRLAPGVSLAAAHSAVDGVLGDLEGVMAVDRSQLLAGQQKQVDRLLVPITALLVLSVLIGLVGIANTVALSVRERTRELGLLRAVGLARRQLTRMVHAEALMIALLGAVLGLVLAVALGSALVAVLHDVGITVLVVPVAQLAGSAALSVLAGTLASVLPARRAARLPVLSALSAV